MCKKTVADDCRQCPRCQTDLSLLVDYATCLEEGIRRAEYFTRQGQLAEAVWAYLEVLEVDPAHPRACEQIGRIATAVRAFDQVASGPRWLARLRCRERFRHWLHGWNASPRKFWNSAILAAALLAIGFAIGYYLR
ncbi:MAG: hypothetical protein KatS3mg105_3848 [Gemmatales bacterium]|nr:MAG: hypothetical protein KatS3mg105_3848 [Gemmatales bacterium]